MEGIKNFSTKLRDLLKYVQVQASSNARCFETLRLVLIKQIFEFPDFELSVVQHIKL